METRQQLAGARAASAGLINLSEEKINAVLGALAARIEQSAGELLDANARDLAAMPESDPRHDRLKLTEARLAGIAGDVRNVAKLETPVGKILSETVRPNGLLIKKISVPFGVIGVIYEARPNVTFDVFSLCFKTQNASVLRGGKEAQHSNAAGVKIIRDVLREHGLDENIATLLPATREAAGELLAARGFVDVLIPRGSQALIDFVRENARIPTIETGAGVVHVYFDKTGDIAKGRAIIFNAKTRRVSVCNALDCLLVERSRLADLPALVAGLEAQNVEFFADAESFSALSAGGKNYPPALLRRASPEDFGTEFLAYRMAIKTVAGIDEALAHIAAHGSQHSESIVSETPATCEKFSREVDAAVVYANASTAFTDGAQFGLGAEIGISTQKLHARGPMGLEALTTYKWIVTGDGQTRT